MTVNELIRQLTKYPGNMVVKSRGKFGDYTDVSVFKVNKELFVLGVGIYKDKFEGEEDLKEIEPEKIYLV